ncbi:MAG: hypothetical protein CM15mV10_1500 [uncultured marine virus]|nr:MAG: hypothetical protein CM15mV10_1500 [uncultured marine virus]
MEGAAWTKSQVSLPLVDLMKRKKVLRERKSGSDLKAPVTDPNPKKGGKAEGRQNSFCKRMKGMKRNLPKLRLQEIQIQELISHLESGSVMRATL